MWRYTRSILLGLLLSVSMIGTNFTHAQTCKKLWLLTSNEFGMSFSTTNTIPKDVELIGLNTEQYYATSLHEDSNRLVIIPTIDASRIGAGRSMYIYDLTEREIIWSAPSDKGTFYFQASLSPDGGKLLYLNGTTSLGLGNVEWFDLETGEVFAVTDDVDGENRDPEDITTWRIDNYYNPLWSPDGTKVVYQYHTPNGGAELHAYDIARDEIEVLADDLWIDVGVYDEEGVSSIYHHSYPPSRMSWTPDGESVTYINRVERGGIDRWGLVVLNIKNGEKEVLYDTGPVAHGYSPVWSPDGTKIGFASRKSWSILGGFTTYVFDVETEEFTHINVEQRWDDVIWSPNSQQLAYVKQENGERITIVYHLVSKEERSLARGRLTLTTRISGWYNICLGEGEKFATPTPN